MTPTELVEKVAETFPSTHISVSQKISVSYNRYGPIYYDDDTEIKIEHNWKWRLCINLKNMFLGRECTYTKEYFGADGQTIEELDQMYMDWLKVTQQKETNYAND